MDLKKFLLEFLGAVFLALAGNAIFYIVPWLPQISQICGGINWDATCAKEVGTISKQLLPYLIQHASDLGIEVMVLTASIKGILMIRFRRV